MAIMLTFLFSFGIAYAAFGDQAKFVGSTFSVGSADLKLLGDLSIDPVASNLFDDLPGVNFDNINSTWSADYPLKLYNNTDSILSLTSNSNYETSNDPDDLRQDLYVEIFSWNDLNKDGIVEDTELGTSLGKKTFVKWKTEGFLLTDISPREVNGYLLRFSAEGITDSQQGSTAIFDFDFDSLGN
jgi:hypothetical protein